MGRLYPPKRPAIHHGTVPRSHQRPCALQPSRPDADAPATSRQEPPDALQAPGMLPLLPPPSSPSSLLPPPCSIRPPSMLSPSAALQNPDRLAVVLNPLAADSLSITSVINWIPWALTADVHKLLSITQHHNPATNFNCKFAMATKCGSAAGYCVLLMFILLCVALLQAKVWAVWQWISIAMATNSEANDSYDPLKD
jgi:hypothetical protein